jgi:hypothetical protein
MTTWTAKKKRRMYRLKQTGFLFSMPRTAATIRAETAKTPVEMITGREMKRTPYIAQFSEYDLSSQAHPTKNAERIEHSHKRTESAARAVLLFFALPTMTRATARMMYRDTAGISMGFFAFLWLSRAYTGQYKIPSCLCGKFTFFYKKPLVQCLLPLVKVVN